jgi:hypothetical protein
MIGEVAGTEDLAAGPRIARQGDAANQVFQSGQGTARHSLDAVRKDLCRHPTTNDFPEIGFGRGWHVRQRVRPGTRGKPAGFASNGSAQGR